MSPQNFIKTKVHFKSEELFCSGYFYFPTNTIGFVPCIVMAHGFSATMDWILPDFAERFVTAGLSVLTFDYRHLGESEGQPRQIVDVIKQRKDLENAVAWARSREGVDPSRIAVWGTSLGGSHTVELAARDPMLAAVILNMPALDAMKGANVSTKMKLAKMNWVQMIAATLNLLGLATFDKIKGLLNLEPHYIPVYGSPGKSFFSDKSLSHRFNQVAAGSRTWQNRIAPRFIFQAPRYTEGLIEEIKAPILVCLAQEDIEVSNEFIKDKVGKSARAEIKEYPYGHFEMYHGTAFELVVKDQITFLKKYLTEHS